MTPTPARTVRVLKDGTWERLELIRLECGELRVRKSAKPGVLAPWGVSVLRAEIRYLRALDPQLARHFPRLLCSWGEEPGTQEPGYEMTYLEGWQDLGGLIHLQEQGQAQADAFQAELAALVFGKLHRPQPQAAPLRRHVEAVFRECLTRLGEDPAIRPLLESQRLRVNGRPLQGLARLLDRIKSQGLLLESLGAPPAVRLHGDLFLENILWNPKPPEGAPRLVLVDPVSVAGVSAGTPLFDLVKYESYATGELYAMRTGCLEAEPLPGRSVEPCAEYRFRIRWEEPSLRPFRLVDWRTVFRRGYREAYGAIAVRPYRLLEGYFALVMAVNTQGLQRLARILKALSVLQMACG